MVIVCLLTSNMEQETDDHHDCIHGQPDNYCTIIAACWIIASCDAATAGAAANAAAAKFRSILSTLQTQEAWNKEERAGKGREGETQGGKKRKGGKGRRNVAYGHL